MTSGTSVIDAPVEKEEEAPPRLSFGGGGGHNDRGDGGGGGGGGGGDGNDGRGSGDGPHREEFPISPAKLAMAFILFSLSVLFLVTTFGALMLRRDPSWSPGATPSFPPILWVNTLVLLGSSATLRRAVKAIRVGDARTLARGLGLTWVLGGAFVLGQWSAWHELARQGAALGTGNYATVFHWLTGLHAAHVLGGLVSLATCTVRARRGLYSPASHVGVELCELYWHFLGVVWVVLLATLFVIL